MKQCGLRAFVTALVALAAIVCFIPATGFAQPAPPPPAQSLYVSSGDGNIYRYASDGSRSTFATGNAMVNAPQALAFDNNGNLYAADVGTGTIDQFTPNGAPNTFVSFTATGLNVRWDGNYGAQVFSAPAMTFDSGGNLYLACTTETETNQGWAILLSGFGAVYQFPSNSLSSLSQTQTYPLYSVGNPGGMAFDSSGNLFVAGYDGYNSVGNIYEIAPDGTQTTVVTGLDGLGGMAINSAGDLFVADIAGNLKSQIGSILEFLPQDDGTFAENTFASGLINPAGLAFDSAGDLFVADSGPINIALDGPGGGSIYEYAIDGSRSTFASGLDGPSGIAFGPSGLDGSSAPPLGGSLLGPTVAPEPSVLAAQVALGGLLLGGTLLLRWYRGRVIA